MPSQYATDQIRPDLRAGFVIGDLVLVALQPDGRWRCHCACGAVVVRDTHALNLAVYRRSHSSCEECRKERLRRQGNVRAKKRLTAPLTAEQKARVEKIVRGRKGLQIYEEAVEIVTLNLDIESNYQPLDPFRCNFAHRYQG